MWIGVEKEHQRAPPLLPETSHIPAVLISPAHSSAHEVEVHLGIVYGPYTLVGPGMALVGPGRPWYGPGMALVGPGRPWYGPGKPW